MKQIRDRKRLSNYVFVVGPLIIIATLIGLTYAFFNYTRTGGANVVRTGQINFSTTQSSGQSGSINLTNVFPIDVTNGIPNNNSNVGEVTINVTGSTEYTGGIEYLVTATNVTNTVNGKTVPISIDVTGNNLGTEDEEYFENRENNPLTSIYKIVAYDVIEEDEQLIVGYIKPGQTGINGTITIKAYLDADKVAISDTYYENAPTPTPTAPNDEYGTTTEWVDGRTVLTTAEWNSLQSSGFSFKVKVEANEGTWVDEVRSVNAMINIFNSGSDIEAQKGNIKEVYFNKMGATRMQNAYDEATIKADLTANNEGKVLAWLETNQTDNTKYNLIIASDGDTYFPVSSEGMFNDFSNTTTIVFNNINTSRVTNMQALFFRCSSLENINLSNFNTSNVQNMANMFQECSSLTSLNISYLNTSEVTSMMSMFNGCSGLTSLDFTGLDTDKVQNMSSMFYNCTGLTSIDMSGLSTDSILQMNNMFHNCTALTSINLSGMGGNLLSNITDMFFNCNSVEYVDLSGFNFGLVTTLSFSGLTGLQIIDLSDVIITNVTKTDGLFAYYTNLTTIYASNTWNANNITSSYGMFYGCSSLVGEAPNQTYSFDGSLAIDKTYAKIATDSERGYLTNVSLKPTT